MKKWLIPQWFLSYSHLNLIQTVWIIYITRYKRSQSYTSGSLWVEWFYFICTTWIVGIMSTTSADASVKTFAERSRPRRTARPRTSQIIPKTDVLGQKFSKIVTTHPKACPGLSRLDVQKNQKFRRPRTPMFPSYISSRTSKIHISWMLLSLMRHWEFYFFF